MLYKSTVVIWTDYNPGGMELSDLAREAERGDAYCAKMETLTVAHPESDEDAPDMEFFGEEPDDA